MAQTVLVAGLGTQSDFGMALVRALVDAGYAVAALGRRDGPLERLRQDVGPPERLRTHRVDLTIAEDVTAVVDEVERELGPIGIYVHNAARLVTGRFLETDIEAFRDAWRANVETALVPSRVIMPRLAQRGRGVAIFTGATAALRGGAGFGPFASAKFALRGLAQSLARELGPQGVHVVHVVVDGVIWGERAEHQFEMSRDACIDPHALAETYLQLIRQHPSCWTHEVDLRPASEKF